MLIRGEARFGDPWASAASGEGSNVTLKYKRLSSDQTDVRSPERLLIGKFDPPSGGKR